MRIYSIMLKYIDYLNGACHYYGFLDENKFNEIAENFSNINSIDYSNFEFGEDNLEQYILEIIIGEEINDYCVDYVDDKRVWICCFGNYGCLDELNKLKEILNKYGYSIANYDDIVSDIENYNRANKLHLVKSKINDKLDEMTVEQLEKLLSEWK